MATAYVYGQENLERVIDVFHEITGRKPIVELIDGDIANQLGMNYHYRVYDTVISQRDFDRIAESRGIGHILA